MPNSVAGEQRRTRLSKITRSTLAAIILALAMPGTALASHGKVGLWRVTSTIALGADPDRSKMSPFVLAHTKGRTQTFAADHCMSQTEVNADQIPQPAGKNCHLGSAKGSALNYSADIVCTGAQGGTAHVTAKYDSPEHYSGSSTFVGAGDRVMNSKTIFEGRWIKADCGKVTQ